MPVTVAVDAMGGDHGPSVTVPASLRFLEETPDARVIVVGLEGPLKAVLAKQRSPAQDRLTIHPATEVVEMHEPPADALRRKKDSSLRVAVNLVKDGTAQACVSAGQHRRADGDLAVRAEDAAGHRPARDRFAAAHPHRRHDGARSRRQRELHARAARAVRGDGHRARRDGRGHRAPDRRAPQHRRGRHQGQRRRQGDRRAPEGLRAQLTTATSRAPTSTRARPTSSSATASSATSRSRPRRAWSRCSTSS